jgi:hypothetical protein
MTRDDVQLWRDAYVEAWKTYDYTDTSRVTLEMEYFNAYLLGFDSEGRCAWFTEYYMLRPEGNPLTDVYVFEVDERIPGSTGPGRRSSNVAEAPPLK